MAVSAACLMSGVVAADAAADTGALAQKPGVGGCVAFNFAACGPGRALANAQAIVVSPDGASAYVASYSSHAVAAFDRAPDGTLTQKPAAEAASQMTGAVPATTPRRSPGPSR